MTARARILAGTLAAALTLGACAEAAVDTTGLRGAALEGEESTTTTTTVAEGTTTTTTIPAGPCHAPQPAPVSWEGDLLAIHGAVSGLVAAAVTLDNAIRAVGDFSPGWAEQAPVGGALYDFQVHRYELMADLEAAFLAAGATFISPGGWSFPGDATLAPLAAAWEVALLDDYRTDSLPALLDAATGAGATALLDAGAVCGMVDGFSDALDVISAGG